MKKYLLGLTAVVVALSLSAFTGDYKKNPGFKGDGDLHWFVAPYGVGDYRATTSSAEERTLEIECEEDGSIECERAFTDQELNNPLSPAAGVDPNKVNTIADQIFLP